jgi:pantoate--beta-alanine ligase
MGVELRIAQTMREPDGLALSSRNTYLDAVTRRQASALYGAITAARRCVEAGERDPRRIEATATEVLRSAGIDRIDYVELRDAGDLSALDAVNGRVILALAAYAGATRLIDNMVFNVHDSTVESDVILY